MKKVLLLISALLVSVFLNVYSQTVAYDTLDINNISALIVNNGNLFWDGVNNAHFEVPKGSGKSTIFTSTLWIGGMDINDQLHLAATRYNQVGHDYWAGPISNVYDSAYDAMWNKTWKVYKSDIDYFKDHWWWTGYVIPQSILNWPAHGNVSLGQFQGIAPFFDRSQDGIYNPYDGDYPRIKGDESVFFVFNDARDQHTESGGLKLGIEVRAMAYAFACDEDSALWNTIFINYQICNLSTYSYHETYIGIFTDLDLGYANDDYIGSDVQRGSYYAYNGKNIDGAGQSYVYGAFPPAQSVTFLGGPYMGADGIDNSSGQCDAGVNGINFGNGTVDDERHGMNRFIYFNNTGQGAPYYSTDPDSGMYYYSYLKGFWKDGTQLIYGGNAHAGTGGYGPECNFMFPGDSDTCRWGTNGLYPNGPTYWTEQTAGNQPDDRRGVGGTGPFTFQPGSIQQLDLAYVFGRNYLDSNAWAGVQVMQQRIDSIRKYFINDTTPCGGGFSGLPVIPEKKQQIIIFPNPANDHININVPERSAIEILNIEGQLIKRINTNEEQTTIDIAGFAKGMYFVKARTQKGIMVAKFIKD
jgi:hypothetical protein